ncbi:hypothetical protein HD806DRAFT_553019 [Xylariaceae sp. AK1471]|nr:hypothetical protein HD806DRAFT_553019 [Xylariaceae sp. AK1471]
MPRSGYDRTNLTEDERNTQAVQASAIALGHGAHTVPATSIYSPSPPSVSISDSFPSLPFFQPPTPVLPAPTTVLPTTTSSSSTLLSSTIQAPINISSPSIVPLPSAPSSISISTAVVSSSPTYISHASSILPSSATTTAEVERAPLPTVRVSPGYVEYTGGYRVYNNSTGRGWRYAPPLVQGPVSSSSAPHRNISGHSRRRRLPITVRRQIFNAEEARRSAIQPVALGESVNCPPRVNSRSTIPRYSQLLSSPTSNSPSQEEIPETTDNLVTTHPTDDTEDGE